MTQEEIESLEQMIYESIMSITIPCECGESAELGMGEMGEVRDEANRIVSDWIDKNNIIRE